MNWASVHSFEKNITLCILVGCSPEQQMLYAGSVRNLVSEAGLTKVGPYLRAPYFRALSSEFRCGIPGVVS